MKFFYLSLAVLFAGVACTARAGDGGSGGDPMQPVIDSISPTSGRMGQAYPVRVTVYGRGFADSANVVSFGNVEVGPYRATGDGTMLEFMAPKVRSNPDGDAPPRALQPGEYPVSVKTPSGVSNAMPFTMTR